MTRQVTSSRGGPDRWLVSYADFVTLLMAFFTAMYALSASDAATSAAASASITAAFGATPAAAARTGTAPTVPVPVKAQLAEAFSEAIRSRRLEISEDPRGVVLSLPEGATFALGSADVTAEARALLAQLVSTLRPLGYAIRVEGHTDDESIRTSRFASNWELSTARASAVVALFIDEDIDPRRLSAAGYGEFHPRVPNASPAARAQNRRVDVVILPTAPDRTGVGGTEAGLD